MRLKVINGPNLNMLGIREPDVYGDMRYDDLCALIKKWGRDNWAEIDIEQSNYEGAIIDMLHRSYFDDYDGLIINAGAFTHYSYAIRDAIAILKIPVIEVHISDIYAREAFRRISVIEEVCKKQISGKGIEGYKEAIEYLTNLASNRTDK